jgi:D-alanyl-D-alanine carboxypeptidase
MPAFLLAVLLPTLFWDQPADTAAALHAAGIERLSVPAGREAGWQKQGFAASPFDPARAVQATAPHVEYHMDVASATHVPWVDANGWRFVREPSRTYFYDAPRGAAALAAAEAFAYGVEAAVRPVPEDLDAFARMLKFLGAIGRPRLPLMANIGVVDDGSELMGEVLNLMARHNLLFNVVPAPDPRYDLNIRLGTPEFTKEDAADPYQFALSVRRKLTDEKRLLRIYGSNVVLARLEGGGGKARVHLLNYGGRVLRGLRVRVLGSYPHGKLSAFDHETAALQDYAVEGGATEFSISEMGPYAVVDLESSPPAAQVSPGLEPKLSGVIGAALQKSGAPSASVAVVENGRVVYAKAFGSADLAAARAAGVETRYAVGSISKQFTAAAILLLQEQGRLSLDDRVSKYFPDLTRAGEITIRQLLSHTSGYEDYAPQDYMIPEWMKPTTPRAILDRWAKKPLNFDPGTRWQYSNTNYVLAGEIFEKAAGRPLLSFLREKIFDPLGMPSAGDCQAASPADATAYTRFALGPPRPALREAAGWYFAAGELCMTPSDLARWDIAFLQHKILSARSYDEFTREVKLNNGNLTHYALGLQLGDWNGIPMIYHGGEVSGFLALNTVYPTRDSAVVVLTNEDGISLIGPLSRQIAGALFSPERPPAAPPAETQQVRAILEGLRKGKLDRAQFTANANFYFTETALRDCKSSLAGLGKLKSVTRTAESLRGGMIHRSYRAEFQKKTVLLNVYVMPDGKYEQFLVMDQL